MIAVGSSLGPDFDPVGHRQHVLDSFDDSTDNDVLFNILIKYLYSGFTETDWFLCAIEVTKVSGNVLCVLYFEFLSKIDIDFK